MKSKSLYHNARIYTQAAGVVVDSMAVQGNRIVAIGNGLKHDPDFKSFGKIDLRGKMIVPGLVDAHTHFYYFAVSLGRVALDGLPTLDACLKKIKKSSSTLPKNAWVVGDGYSPDRSTRRIQPDRYMLDQVTQGRPAFIFSKDQHNAWVNSEALEAGGIDQHTPDPADAAIDRDQHGVPTGILREHGAYLRVWKKIPPVSDREVDRRWTQALQYAYRKGVTGIHSFDSPEALPYLTARAERGNLGLRIEHYPSAKLLPQLTVSKTYYGTGSPFFRIAGVKIFADGSLGSQTAFCYDPYIGSKRNYGIETTSVKQMVEYAKAAARLGLPCAIHAIGDKAISNVLDALEQRPLPQFGARHRIEHLQMIRPRDIARLKKLGIVASMQPSHCTSDIQLVRRYWGSGGRNAYIFHTLLKAGIDLAFGSDAPIEPLDPLAGIEAAVRRARPRSRDVFYPKERISVEQALFGFTVGPAIAAGQEHCRGYLLPGYPADFTILNDDITKIAASRIGGTEVLATVLDGRVVHLDSSLKL